MQAAKDAASAAAAEPGCCGSNTDILEELRELEENATREAVEGHPTSPVVTENNSQSVSELRKLNNRSAAAKAHRKQKIFVVRLVQLIFHLYQLVHSLKHDLEAMEKKFHDIERDRDVAQRRIPNKDLNKREYNDICQSLPNVDNLKNEMDLSDEAIEDNSPNESGPSLKRVKRTSATASHDPGVSSQERVSQPVPPPVLEAGSLLLRPHSSFAAATTSPPSVDVPHIPTLKVADSYWGTPALHNSMPEWDIAGEGREDEEQVQYNALDLTVVACSVNGSPMHYNSLAWGVNDPDLEDLKYLEDLKDPPKIDSPMHNNFLDSGMNDHDYEDFKDPKDDPETNESFFDRTFGVLHSENLSLSAETNREVEPSGSNGEAPLRHTHSVSSLVADTSRNNKRDLQEQQQNEPGTPAMATAPEGIDLTSSPPPTAAIPSPYFLPQSIANAGDDA